MYDLKNKCDNAKTFFIFLLFHSNNTYIPIQNTYRHKNNVEERSITLKVTPTDNIGRPSVSLSSRCICLL